MKFPKININWKNVGTRALAIGGGLAAIWLAVKPKDEPAISTDILDDLPDVPDEAEGIEEVAAEEQEEETEEESTEEDKSEEG